MEDIKIIKISLGTISHDPALLVFVEDEIEFAKLFLVVCIDSLYSQVFKLS